VPRDGSRQRPRQASPTIPPVAGSGRALSRREALRLALLGAGAVGTASVLGACGRDSPERGGGAGAAERTRPNFLLIVADDMRYDQLEYMPKVRRLLQEKGTAFTQARCNVPLCQPSRVGFFTGQMSKHNQELFVGFFGSKLTDHDNCIGRWMQEAGYRCGHFGKYVNWYDGQGGIDPPAGYEAWHELVTLDLDYDFRVRVGSDVTTVADAYTTDYFAQHATEFIQGTEPFLCVVTPTQPHSPSTPRRDLVDAWSDFRWPVLDEVDVSDKPPWIRNLPPLTEADIEQVVTDARGALRELSAVDDMVEKIVGALDPEVLDNTVVIFTSDNGIHFGEHRRRGSASKSGPYDVGLHVPLLVRGPGFEPGAEVTAPSMVFQDINATMRDLGGAEAGLPHQAGVSLAAIAAAPDDHASRILLHAIAQGFNTDSGDGITTGPDHPLGFRKLYRYPSAGTAPEGPFTYEAYDLDDDPDEHANWADGESRRDERDTLEAELDALLAADQP
jgi:N-acetylglucosamine-6-sulfatase